MDRIIIAAALIIVATVIAVILSRRRPQPPTQASVEIPAQLDRSDFPGQDRSWLLVVWTSLTCASCEQATAKAKLLESPQVAYVELPWQQHRDLHDRYHVADVPLILLADPDGVVRVSFVGAPDLADLVAAVAEAQDQSG